jgi:hypothetical protein
MKMSNKHGSGAFLVMAVAVLFVLAGCSINKDPLGPDYPDYVLFSWTFDNSNEGFVGEEYSEACGGGTVSQQSHVVVASNLYVWVENGNPNLTGGGWYWGGWLKTLSMSSEGTNILGDKMGAPYIMVRVRATNNHSTFLPRKIRMALQGPDAPYTIFAGNSPMIVPSDTYAEFYFYPDVADFRRLSGVLIALDNSIAGQGDSFGYFIDKIELGIR